MKLPFSAGPLASLAAMALSAVPLVAQQPGLDAPVPLAAFLNGTFPANEPGATVGGSWATADVFPSLTFHEPVRIVEHPSEPKLAVVSKTGQVSLTSSEAPGATKSLLLDLTGKTNYPFVGEGGVSGFAFHPEFGQAQSPNRGYLYVAYRYSPGTIGPSIAETTGYNRISRFTVPDGATQASLASELVLIDQYDRLQWHIGGDMFFGSDGFLYIGVGDEGNAWSRLDATQRLDGGLWSGILRIDVNNDPAKSSPIARQPREAAEINAAADSGDEARPTNWPHSATQGYSIPFDNPFHDTEYNPADGGEARFLEEFYAIGMRHPWTIRQDPLTKEIWYADVGENLIEEVGRVVKGGNHQWGYLEGATTSGVISKPQPVIGQEVGPVLEYPHSVGLSVIGAGVYRGSKFPELYGKYLFSDFVNGQLWALDANVQGPIELLSPNENNLPAGVSWVMTLPKGFGSGINSYCLTRDGRVLMAKSNGSSTDGGKILELVRQGQPTPQPPALISQTGVFDDIAGFDLVDAFVPYDLNVPFWSDGAVKSRWLAVPNNGTHNTAAETVTTKPDGDLVFPPGTVMVKHFDLVTDWRNPAVKTRLETRFGIKTQSGGWYGVTYRWNSAGTDATLLYQSETEEFEITDLDGNTFTQPWFFPGRLDCLTCHNPAADGSLGVSIHQLNRDHFYPSTGRTANELFTFNHLGMFADPLEPAQIPNLPKSAPTADTSQPLELRARSYLDSNCSYCHQPGGVRANFDARLGTPLFGSNLIFGNLVESLELGQDAVIVPGDLERSAAYVRAHSAGQTYSMPPLAKNFIDLDGTDLLAQWIDSLATSMGNATNLDGAFIDAHGPSLYVNETDTFTNTRAEPLVVTVNSFSFYAPRKGNPLTPFVARVDGDNAFTVLAVGTPRTNQQYQVGANEFPFDESSLVTITLQPGETIAPGFLDSFPNGTGWGGLTVIPAEQGSGADQDEIWALLPNPLVESGSGYDAAVDTPLLVEGQDPLATNAGRALSPYTNLRRSYRFAIGLQQGSGFDPAETPVDPGGGNTLLLGNDPSVDGTVVDYWQSNLYVNTADGYTNTGDEPVRVAVQSFAFYAARLSGPVTPFVAKHLGGNNFTVLAIGATRTSQDYQIGPNEFAFASGSEPEFLLGPDETMVTGFLDALPDGTLPPGTANGAGPIPNNGNNADAVWFSGGQSPADSASVQVGGPITPGTVSMNLNRNYHYNIGFFIGDVPPPDADGDGVPDDEDAFPNDPNETTDSDGDGVGDNADAFPNDPTETNDSDGDGIGDNSDPYPNDPDNGSGGGDLTLGNDATQNGPSLDGWASNLYVNTSDTYQNSTGAPVEVAVRSFAFYAARLSGPVTPFVVRLDGGNNFTVLAVGASRTGQVYQVGANQFPFADGGAGFTLQPGETIATGFLDALADGTLPAGTTNGAGPIPNDTVSADAVWFSGGQTAADSASVQAGSPIDPGTVSLNLNRNYHYHINFFVGDGSPPADSDGDGVPDDQDDFPNDPAETTDSDGDGVGDNSDAFPNDPGETIDSDGDGVGDNSDAFPNDPGETTDSDGDGVGDNADAFPNDPTETSDRDGDGIGDNSDPYPDDPDNGGDPTDVEVVLGNDPSQTYPIFDAWASNLYINKTDTFTNTSGGALPVSVQGFDFFAGRLADPVTPFVVRLNGGDDFTVLAIGTTRTSNAYLVGPNSFPFTDGAAPTITLAAGETIAPGFIDSLADGSLPPGVPGIGGPIPYQSLFGSDIMHFTGGVTPAESASLVLGGPVQPGSFTIDVNRDYRYQIRLLTGEGPADPDSDGDGVPDSEDAFPNDPTETSDRDGDGIGDNSDPYPDDPNNGGGMLQNTSFETGAPGNTTTLDGWSVTQGSVGIVTDFSTDGNQALDLNGSAPGAITQTVGGLAPNALHTIFLDWADQTGRTGAVLATAEVRANGVLIGTIRTASKAPEFVDCNGFEFTTPANGTVTLSITSTTAGTTGLLIDRLRLLPGGLPAPPESPFLVNGSFEEPVIGNPPYNPHVCGYAVPGWVVTRENVDLITIPAFGAADGDTIIDVGGHGPGGIAQTITGLTPGDTYQLRYAYARHRYWSPPTVLTADVLINGVVVKNLSRDVNVSAQVAPNFTYDTIDVVAPADGKVTIEFRSTALTVGGGITFDDVSFVKP